MTFKMEGGSNDENEQLLSQDSYEGASIQSEIVPDVTVKSVKQAQKPSKTHLILAILACVLGSPFQIGFNTASLNAPQEIIKSFYNQTYHSRHNESMPDSLLTMLWAITVAVFCIGGMIGGVLSSYLSKRFGRKNILLWNNAFAFLSAGMQASSKYVPSYELLIVGRVVSGINCGLNSAIAPTYLAEIAPISLRGFCGTCNQLAIVFGVLTAEVIGSEQLLGTEDLWQFVLAAAAVPGVYSLLTLSWCPESPKYLMLSEGDEQAARKALVWFRGTSDVSAEMEAMKEERRQIQTARKFSFTDLWKSSHLRKPLVICLVLQMSQQLSGINAVIYYSTSIFHMAGLSVSLSQLATIGTGVVNFLMTFVSALIMDRAGRRTLHLTGLSGMCVFSVVLVLCLIFQTSVSWLSYISVVAVVIYIIFFATGPGSIPWFIVAEMFEQGPRSAAVSISVVVNWFSNFLVGLTYPILEKSIKNYSFLPFSGMLLFFCIFTYFFVPETKGKTITEITMIFKAPDDTDTDIDAGTNTNVNGHGSTDFGKTSEESPLLAGT